MSKGCLKCGTQNADAATLCRGCGAALGDQPSPLAMARAGASPVCRVCGHVNRSATRFCSKCGSDQTLLTDPDPATEPVDYSILASLPPRASAAAVRTPAHPAADLFGAEPAPKPLGLWLGLGALVVALVAGVTWWARSSHVTPTPPPAPAASVAQPSASVAAVVAAPASAPAPEPASTAVAAASAPAVDPPASAPVVVSAPEPVASAAASAVAPAPLPTADADKAAREAKAKALRERRAQAASQAAAARAAEQEAARRRADDARAAAAAAVPAPAPAPAVVPPPAPVLPRTAQETCAGSNLIVRTLCESRECSRREHADEPLCQRLRAAEEKRRQQD